MITLTDPKRYFPMAFLLSIVMVATRFGHFGSVVNLPDASLAIFFLSGVYLRPVGFFPVFLAEAALIDYAAFAFGGVSDWCVTPAYLFLVPTYASLWFTGRWYAHRHHESWRTLAPLSVALFIGTNAAFLISNGSFYMLSGYFGKMGPGEYAARVAEYYPPYVAIAFIYVASAAALHVLVGVFKLRHPAAGTSGGV